MKRQIVAGRTEEEEVKEGVRRGARARCAKIASLCINQFKMEKSDTVSRCIRLCSTLKTQLNFRSCEDFDCEIFLLNHDYFCQTLTNYVLFPNYCINISLTRL